jgi:hypothetical protein
MSTTELEPIQGEMLVTSATHVHVGPTDRLVVMLDNGAHWDRDEIDRKKRDLADLLGINDPEQIVFIIAGRALFTVSTDDGTDTEPTP